MILFLFLKQERAGYDQREKFCCRNCTPDTVETKNIGRISSASVWITKVRRVEMIAEIFPLFSPVKNADPKILNPLNR